MIELIFIIIIFSVIQSLFGVGLLLFGTPTLLLLDYSYSESLWILLPCSITISLIQSISKFELLVDKKKVILFIVPPMVLGLVLVVLCDYVIDIKKIVGFFLILTGLVNFFSKLQSYIKVFINKHAHKYYALIGLIHGLSNMGGGPLSILMSSIYDDKLKIRANIAFIYSVLAASQLIVLFFIEVSGLKYQTFVLMSISLFVFFVTDFLFSTRVNNQIYKVLINILILIYGILVLIT